MCFRCAAITEVLGCPLQKTRAGNKGERLIIPPSSANNHPPFFSRGPGHFSLSSFIFPPLYSFSLIVSIGAFFFCLFGFPKASVFPTLSPVTLVDRKNAGQSEGERGGSGIPHARG